MCLAARTAATAAIALFGFAALAPNASAQASISMTYQGPANGTNPLGNYAGGPLGPLNMQRNDPTSVFQAYCIDFDNAVSVGQTWTARVVSIATLATSQADFNAFVKTLGTAATAGTLGSTFDAATTNEWMKRLRAAGYLADQMVGAPTASWDETHVALWTLFSASVTAPSDPAAATALRNTALTFAQNNPNSFGSWNVLIDANAYNTSYSGPIVQAYMTKSLVVVPEPSTYALMATGLVALGAAVRRRPKSRSRL